MCATCGCSDGAKVTVTDLTTGETQSIGGHDHTHDGHDHPHDHEHPHRHDGHQDHAHTHAHSATITLEQAVLAKNNRLAERNRGWLAGRGVLALNLVSSPGAGKTTLLEHTLRDLAGEMAIDVIEGDQATANDAERIRAAGARAVQVNTGTGCHLEAEMLERALNVLRPRQGSLLLIENVGNLVCPALFDLGERAKVVIFSVTEGEDKPLKYPHMFAAAEVMIVSKTDLLPHVRFDMQQALANARQINPGLRIFTLSSESGEGLTEWYDWLRAELATVAKTEVSA